MRYQQAFNLGRTILVVSAIATPFTKWALAPAFIGWAMMVYGSAE
jgi:hypothetical protein